MATKAPVTAIPTAWTQAAAGNCFIDNEDGIDDVFWAASSSSPSFDISYGSRIRMGDKVTINAGQPIWVITEDKAISIKVMEF